jgi:hypothetical protein
VGYIALSSTVEIRLLNILCGLGNISSNALSDIARFLLDNDFALVTTQTADLPSWCFDTWNIFVIPVSSSYPPDTRTLVNINDHRGLSDYPKWLFVLSTIRTVIHNSPTFSDGHPCFSL